ncbi:MAG: translation initiation factor IF-2, partial [Terriglobales bacterium]
PRPGTAPAGRAATPEGRRPMHPTRPGAGRPAAGRGAAYHSRREPRVKEGPQRFTAPAPVVPSGPLPITREITISEGITVKDLSERLQSRAKDVIRKLFDRGLMVTVNQSLDAEIATQIAREFGAAAKSVTFEEETLKGVVEEAVTDSAHQVPRAPVVTIMGHVDHGKTSLLDAIRESNVAGGEAGGITQHIGAYQVEMQDRNSPAYGRRIVFIDTPGHEAFTRMRARGARITDVVVLVVAADDGVMPQTLEAIDHARAADVPILVAVNKIDKPDAQPDRVKKQLGDRGLLAEDWGGTTVTVNVSAKARTNLNQLLEMILLVTDLQELKANPEAPAQGTVLEAELDRGRGPVARVLVQDGTLRLGDTIILGSVLGRVRALFDDHGQTLESAGPATPVEVLGLEALPEAGDRWTVVSDRSKAKQIALYREEKARDVALARASRMNLEALSQQMAGAGGDLKELPLIIKADMQGSAEVLVDTLAKLSTEKVKVRVIHSGVGAINENDVLLASASNAVIIGFNVRPDRNASDLAEHEKVEIRLHSIIYELTDEIKKAMSGLLEPILKETVLGRAEVRQAFRVPQVGMVAGCYVREGKLTRDAPVRVVRDGTVVYTSKIASLRRFKEDTSEVRNGLECGVGVANFSDIKPGDVLEAFQIEKIVATLAG